MYDGMLKFMCIFQTCYPGLGKAEAENYPLSKFSALTCVLTLWIQLKFSVITVYQALMIWGPVKFEQSFSPVSGLGSLSLLSHVCHTLQGMQGEPTCKIISITDLWFYNPLTNLKTCTA